MEVKLLNLSKGLVSMGENAQQASSKVQSGLWISPAQAGPQPAVSPLVPARNSTQAGVPVSPLEQEGSKVSRRAFDESLHLLAFRGAKSRKKQKMKIAPAMFMKTKGRV
jgi:hypothetical protein